MKQMLLRLQRLKKAEMLMGPVAGLKLFVNLQSRCY